MNPSIAEGSRALTRADGRGRAGPTVVIGAALAIALLVLYLFTRPAWQVMYNHFVWQADGFLHGRTTIDFPVDATSELYGNAFFNDVEPVVDAAGNPTGQARIPFPPLPAVVLLPLVAAWGLATDQGLASIGLGAVDVALAFWLLGRLPIRRSARVAATLFFGAGTALWYAASIGTTWFFAHVVAVGLTLVALALALDADAAQAARGDAGAARSPAAGRWRIEWRQVGAGVLLGLAATSRLTIAFGAVFLLFVGGGGTWFRRGAWAAVGLAVPICAYLLYNLATTGSIFNPVYQTLYEYEVWAYPDLNYNGAWAISDLRYIPQNLGIMLTGMPDVMPACAAGVERTVVNPDACSWVVPRQVGMSFILASPAWLLALVPAFDVRAAGSRTGAGLRDRRVAGALAATVLIAVVNLAHFSQGWVQFGYRFSLDFAPFLLLPVALGIDRLAGRRAGWLVAGGLIAASIAIQAWGIAWARTLGW